MVLCSMQSGCRHDVRRSFCVRGRGDVSARELWVGGRLLDVWDGTLVVENTRLELTEKLVRVYNFQMKKPKRPSMRVMEKI